MRQFCCVIVATAAVAILAVPSAPVTRADNGAKVAISWSQLGLSSRVELVGSNQSTDVSVPVPQGVSPTVLTGVIGSVVNATGRVDVLDARGILLGSVAIPADVAAVPFVVDISAAEVSADIAKLSFVIRDNTAHTDSCVQGPAVTLSQLATTYSGHSPSPRTVADFLPGYLDQITIQVGPNPTRDQQQAALALVAKLTHLYRPMPVRIDIDTSPAPVPAAPGALGTQRTISIRDGDQPGFVVENPGSPAAVLAISGRGPDLLRQVELFAADRRFDLSQTPSASVTSATPVLPKSAETLSFGELGMTPQAAVLGTTTLYIGFDAAAFAVGPIDRARIHLIANYTPVTTGDASMLVRSGSAILASRTLDQSGSVNLSADIPPGAIASNVGLALEIRYIPRQQCAALYDRITFAVDPASTIAVSPGTNNRGGFSVLPMAFTPDFDVAVDTPDQIRYAAQVINLMAQQSTIVLAPTVIGLDEAAKRGTGLLVVAPGDKLTQAGMRPPLLTTGADAVDVNGSPVTGIDLNGPLGVIEAFSHNGRMVLAVGYSGDRALVDRSFDYIRGLEGRWSSLSGDVVATGAAGTTVNLTVRAGGPMAAQPASEGWKWWTWFTIALGATVVLAVTLVLVVRWRRAKG
ncbi:hypothetical protein [Mycolicibacterium monacense]|uniref:hypothetical protein n=1 Tax=Mycolicibacterium monacense TaxID=85693 RepID=UPI001F60211B|nr:hypothetical protein [Mycolicibacterium monacense]MDA4103821.1 hypothetical protein [Mycolicibacterium monacense DSM 44395]